MMLGCSTGGILSRAAFMHHDEHGHDAFMYYAVIKGLTRMSGWYSNVRDNVITGLDSMITWYTSDLPPGGCTPCPDSIGPWGPYVFYLGQLSLPKSGLWSFLSRAISGSPDGPAQGKKS